MKVFVYRKVPKGMSNATVNGHYLRVVEWNYKSIPENNVSAKTFNSALNKIADLLPEAVLTQTIPLRSLTKRELVDRLIERGLAEGFAAILDSLPLAEKLRYDASPTISPEYPYIAENLTAICTTLGITEEAFKDIFR